jgi:hypothetical protein
MHASYLRLRHSINLLQSVGGRGKGFEGAEFDILSKPSNVGDSLLHLGYLIEFFNFKKAVARCGLIQQEGRHGPRCLQGPLVDLMLQFINCQLRCGVAYKSRPKCNQAEGAMQF